MDNQNMEKLFPIAHALAADLAGSSVDVNEAQKAFAYMQRKRSGHALFDYLQAVISHGDAVVRSGRTMSYYRNLQDACSHHLRTLVGDYEAMRLVYGWSMRLLRFYRDMPEARQRAATQDVAAVAPSPPPSPPREKTIPDKGKVFTSDILDLDDDVVMIAIPGFSEEAAIGVINRPEGKRPRYRKGNAARVKVVAVKTAKGGRKVVELEPAPQKKKKP